MTLPHPATQTSIGRVGATRRSALSSHFTLHQRQRWQIHIHTSPSPLSTDSSLLRASSGSLPLLFYFSIHFCSLRHFYHGLRRLPGCASHLVPAMAMTSALVVYLPLSHSHRPLLPSPLPSPFIRILAQSLGSVSVLSLIRPHRSHAARSCRVPQCAGCVPGGLEYHTRHATSEPMCQLARSLHRYECRRQVATR